MSSRSDLRSLPGRWDARVKRLGEVLADDESRRKLFARAARAGCIVSAVLLYGYAFSLLGAALCARFVGESNLTVAYLLYFPRIIFLLPALVFLPLGILFCRRGALVLAGAALVFFFITMGFEPRPRPVPSPSSPGGSLTVLTYNRGQHSNQSLQPFMNRTDPDVIVLQEARGRAAGYAKAEGYETFSYTLDEGEFTVLSRYPIGRAESIRLPASGHDMPVAARFEIDFGGTRIALYAVHVLSPRDALRSYRRGAFLWGVLGLPGTPFAKKRKAYEEFWDGRIEEARGLREILLEDPLPTLIAGDLNAPAGGYIHGLFDSAFEDAHAAGGHGFGYTFPGTTRNPLSLGGPWIRLDYLFCDDHWETQWCITERERPSQHRAVTAQFRLREDRPGTP